MGSELGDLLRRLRREHSASKQRLSDAADVSTTYISQIESGVDPRTKRPFQPSPAVLRRLARALAGDDQREARRLYEALLAAAGYLPEDTAEEDWPAAPAPAMAAEASPEEPEGKAEELLPPEREDGLIARLRRGAAERDGPATVELRDPRLRPETRAVLEHWEMLDRAEMDAFYAVVHLIASRHGWVAPNRPY